MKDRAYETIKRQILDGTFPPGTFLSERQQAEALDMSKTPVRAALERLSEQGLVDTSPQRGVIVRGLTERQIADHYDIRVALETFIVKRLSEHLDAASQRELEAILAEQESALHRGDVLGFVDADVRYHLALAGADGNQEIIATMQQSVERLQHVIGAIFTRNDQLPVLALSDHRSVLDDIKRGDGEAAAAHMTEHLLDSREFLLLGGRTLPKRLAERRAQASDAQPG